MKDFYKLYDSTIFFESKFLNSLKNELEGYGKNGTYSLNSWNDGSGNNQSILDGMLLAKIIDNLKVNFIKDILYAISYCYQEPHIEGKYHIDDYPNNNGVVRQSCLVFPIQNCSPTYFKENFKEDGSIYECAYTNDQCALLNGKRIHRAVNSSNTRRVNMQISFTQPFKTIKDLIDTNINKVHL